ncbi:MAG: hemolysin III family protein [Actinomycetota bacterium]
MKPVTTEAPTAPPKLRGWFHLGAAPVVFIASLVLFILSKDSLKFAVALYSITAITLFSVSAIYHRVQWSPSKKRFWRRWDHANINLLIAGSVTPFAVTLLTGRDRTILLSVVWIGALIGVAVRIFWLGAPRWLYVANYLALGWVAIVYTPQLYRAGGLWILLPIIIGGLFYSAGAIFYVLKRPGRNARYFGFHELFHIFVIAAWISQYIAVSIAIYRQ